ncbi:ECM16 [Candida theae]|uniref:RNA helicase n=1 Tax=Candida theae TaxID=1198502 RepID=A0AAD5BDE4_9ASCO|nr:ECM16 [Candida theae]KAI5957492.1 ECM16 [Candida theae]
MGKYRKRFNEKARTGMLAKQAALKKARNKQFYTQDDGTNSHDDVGDDNPPSADIPINAQNTDSNAEILAPVSEEERLARKRALEENLYTQNSKDEKLSKAKKKRLDKYIEHQLKREEKKELLRKLEETKMDTSKLSALKDLGKGRLTKREQMVEALELEKQGRGDENTRETLYEERVVKDFSEDESAEEEGTEERSSSLNTSTPSSTFLDNRPSKFGGAGMGFGFKNVPVIKRDTEVAKKKYSWRKRVQDEDKKRQKQEDLDDFVSSSEDASSSDEESGEEDDDTEGESTEEENETNGRASRMSTGDSENTSSSEHDDSGEDSDQGGQAEVEEVEASNESNDVDEDDEDDEDDDDEDDDDEDEDDEDEDDEDDDDEDGDDEDDDDDDEDDDDDDDEHPTKLMQNKPKHSKTATSFKDWAEQQLRHIEGRDNVPLVAEVSDEIKQKYSKRNVRPEDVDHMSEEEGYISIDQDMQRDAFVVDVQRSDDVQQQRVLLPVYAEEHRIMEAIYHHDCIILCGETGSGKTTQVPQFLYEAGFGNHGNKLYPGMIGVTQPRRVAAVSMAERVGNELGNHKSRVGYQVRFDTSIKNEGTENGTALKFMTDGVLLREMMTDFLLTKYSSIIIDEAHERNINTDILIGMLTRVVKLRRKHYMEKKKNVTPLKLIIMSATLRVSDFSENPTLFQTSPPIINVEARQYPVSVHFDKKTEFNYIDAAFNKACKIHRKLPPGGILIFLTGQNEIKTLVKRLKEEFPETKNKSVENEEETQDVRVSENVQQEVEDVDFSVKIEDGKTYDDYNDSNGEEEEEEEGFEEAQNASESEIGPLHVLPLYSLLPTNQQMRVFDEPPAGSRLCIVATNVAETSLTIPGIRYVIDCGRSKERNYNKENGVQSFDVDWISKASADQRAGRAGRTGPGHCYRLFSSAVYEEFFPQFSIPEILRTPFESIVLSMKSMGIDHIVNFPFPTPPDRAALKKAEELLVVLGALDKDQKQITELGRKMSLFPLSPRFAKILIIGNQQNCLEYIIAIVSALSVGDPFIPENELIGNMTEEERKAFRSRFYQSRALFSKLDPSSECLMLLSAVCALDHIPADRINEFMSTNYLRQKMMQEIQKLRVQVAQIVERCLISKSGAQLIHKKKLDVPNPKQVSAMKQMIASGFVDHVAIRGDLISADVKIANKTNISNIPYCPVLPFEMDPFVYIHANSLMSRSGKLPSPYLVYQNLSSKSNTTEVEEHTKIRMKPLVDITGKQLTNIAKSSGLITYSKPLGHPYAPKNLSPTKRECYVVPRFGASVGSGGVGWDLPAIKVIQEKRHGSWVIV